MAKKYIDAKIVLNELEEARELSPVLPLDTIEDFIESFPAADVVEVRHGRWEKVNDNPYEYVGMCSVCRNEVKQPTCMLKPIYSYCPICGALMDKEEE